MFCGLISLLQRHVARCEQTDFDVVNWEDVAVVHHQIDVIEGNAFRLEAVIDNLLMEAGIVLAPGDALLSDRKCNVPVAQKAGTDIVVVGVNAKNVSVVLGHEAFSSLGQNT